MIREVWENRHPDCGLQERVVYFECNACGKDADYFERLEHGAPCYCEEHALENGWAKCSVCGDIFLDTDLCLIGDELFCDGCIDDYQTRCQHEDEWLVSNPQEEE